MNWLTQVTSAPSFTKIAVSSTLDCAFHRWDASGVCSVCSVPPRSTESGDAEELLGPRSPGHAEEVGVGVHLLHSLYILI